MIYIETYRHIRRGRIETVAAHGVVYAWPLGPGSPVRLALSIIQN
jgi:hypothetical protein